MTTPEIMKELTIKLSDKFSSLKNELEGKGLLNYVVKGTPKPPIDNPSRTVLLKLLKQAYKLSKELVDAQIDEFSNAPSTVTGNNVITCRGMSCSQSLDDDRMCDLIYQNEGLAWFCPACNNKDEDEPSPLTQRILEDKLANFEKSMIGKLEDQIAAITSTVSTELAKQIEPIAAADGQTHLPYSVPYSEAHLGSARLVISGEADDINSANGVLAKIPTEYKRKKKDGSVQYWFKSAEEMNKAATKVESENVNVGVKKFVHEPKLSIRGADVSFIPKHVTDMDETDTMILDSIYELNPRVAELLDRGEKMSVVSFQRYSRNENEATIGLKVSKPVGDLILSSCSIHVGNYNCYVEERVFVKQCFKCQGFGHYAGDCKASDPTCFRCAEKHLARECPNKNNRSAFKCSNCTKSRNPSIQSCAHHHNAADPQCPIRLQYLSKN